MDLSGKFTRRRLLTQAPALGAALSASATAAAPGGRTGKADDAFRVGCLNVASYSHLPANWAPLINPRPGADEIPLTGMRITHCWDIDPERAQVFAKTYGCQAVPKFDAMLGKVDGIISGGYYNHPWNHLLHEPYLAAGLPNLINRPFSNSLAKARRIVATARQHGATILVPSAFEHNNAIASARAWAAGKKIACYSAVNSLDEYPTHGIHGVYLVCRAIVEAGNPVVSVSYRAASWHKPPGLLTYEHRDRDGRRFFGTLHQIAPGPAAIQIHTPEEPLGKSFQIEMGSGYPYNKTEMWAPTLWAFHRMALSGRMPQSFDEILHKHQVYLAGWRSILTNDGHPVKLEDVPEDWETPVELPSRPGDVTVSLFKKRFG
jgi:hypothetical protein